MSAGPSKEEVTRGTRQALQRIAKQVGGRYVPPSHHSAGYVQAPGLTVKARVIRASNAETALLFQAERWQGEGVLSVGGWHVASADALREVGAEVLA